MICPECQQRFDGNDGSCPRCGAVKGVVKTSTILISSGETRKVYRSVEDVPDGLKRQLLRSTNGLNSATIVIADRQGRKEIAKAIRNLPGSVKPEPGRPRAESKMTLRYASAAVALMAVAALIWVLFR